MTRHDNAPRRGSTMRVVRSRGALSGFLLVLLGIWGALIPFVGPYFSYAYSPNSAWAWTAGRFWLEVLPGVAAVLGGLMLMTTANRSVGVFAGWLASLAGAWFVVGPVLGRLWNGGEGAAGTPTGGTARQVWEQIGFFSGLGAAILFLGAVALGRFTVTSVRDLRAADRVRDDRTDGDDRGAGTTTVAPATTEFRDNRVAEPTRPVAQPVAAGSGAAVHDSRGAEAPEGATRPAEAVTRPVESVTRPQEPVVRTEGATGGATRNDALGSHRTD